MPIPNPKESFKFVKLEIYDEVLRAQINANSRYSFLKKSILDDLGIFALNSDISIRVRCNKISEARNFIIAEDLEEDTLLGSEFLREFKIQ